MGKKEKDKQIEKREAKNKEKTEDKINPEKKLEKLDITDESKNEIIHLISQLVFSREHRGPLPAPEDFREYEDILPGAADRILKMAEEVTYTKTRDLTRKTCTESRNSLIGLSFAFVLALLFLGISFLMIIKGYPIAGIVAFISELGALVYTFIYGSKIRSKEKSKPQSEHRKYKSKKKA